VKKTSDTFTCDWPAGCNRTTKREASVAWFSLTYRLIDGSSGVTNLNFCSDHETQAVSACLTLGLIAPPAAS
jgi:hypothetical protein